jgi:hypothetical protein
MYAFQYIYVVEVYTLFISREGVKENSLSFPGCTPQRKKGYSLKEEEKLMKRNCIRQPFCEVTKTT